MAASASPPKIRKALLGATTFACGMLAFALFMWTPTTGRGILLYVALFALLIIMAICLVLWKPSGYWPKKPDEE
jgi:hypothetical protein